MVIVSPLILMSLSLMEQRKHRVVERAREREYRICNFLFIVIISLFISNSSKEYHFVAIIITLILGGMVSHLMQLLLSITGAGVVHSELNLM